MTRAFIVIFAHGDELTCAYQPGDTLASSDGGDRYTGLDRFGRVIDQWWYDPSTSATLDRFQYGYDADGNVLYKNNLVNSSFSELYHANSASTGDDASAYDDLNRITAFQRGALSASGNDGSTLDTVATLNSLPNSSQSWNLDSLGNANSVTTDSTPQNRSFNSQNEATTVGSSTLGYDNNGNTTTDDQGHTLVYDAWNRLVAVKMGGTTLASYSYDANGNRVTETENSATTNLYYTSAAQIIEERQGSVVTVQNVWGIDFVNQIVLRDDNSTSGSLGKTGSGLGRRIYQEQDADYNITAQVDTSGNVLQHEIYTPYGVRTVLTAAWISTSDAYGLTYGFQGMRYDPVTGILHADARDYSPTLERWVQPDPDQYINGLSYYQMELENPVSRLDPLGLLVTGTYDKSTGILTVTDNDTHKSVTIPGSCTFSGGTLGYAAIPNGTYDILDHGNRLVGTSRRDPGWYRLDPVDNSPYNDKWDSGPSKGRGEFRLHPGSYSEGCITIKKDCEKLYGQLRHLLDNTKTRWVTDKGYPPYKAILNFGTITVTGGSPTTAPTTGPSTGPAPTTQPSQ